MAFVAAHCNGKIVGARYFADSWLAGGGSVPEGEFLSPRDASGHGTHTASTAAGLPIANVTIDGRRYGPVSGVAPDAQIAVYKVLWGGMGYDADIIAGIDAAVADGVQVLNFSIGSDLGDWEANTPIGVAPQRLAGRGLRRGVGRQHRHREWSYQQRGALGDHGRRGGDQARRGHRQAGRRHQAGRRLAGRPARRWRTAPLVFGDQAGSPDLGAVYCEPGSLDPAKIKGKVVACALSDMFGSAAEIKAKGGAAMVVFDPVGNYRINSIFNFPVVYCRPRSRPARCSTT